MFKIKPGESQSQTIETMKPNKVLISPTETSVSILNNSQEHLQLTSSNINCSNAIIKTQRMLFVPVADNDEEQNVRVSLKDETETNEIPESIKSVGNAMENITQKTESSSERVDIVVKQFEEFSAPKLAKLKLLRYARPISRSFQDFNVLQYSWKENIRNRSLSESTIKMIKVANIDLPAERKMPDNDTEKIYTGAIPKILSKLQEKKKWNSFTIRKLDLIDDGTKYLSQRAKKIREAKEAFFSSSPDSSQPIYEKNDIEIDSVCVTPMDQNEFPELNLSIASNISNISRTTALSKNPRFGFTSITSSIRKVINKNHKNSTKMNSVTELCKQTLYLDITGITKSESINFNPSK